MAEQIDFSNNENEYLPKGLARNVLIISCLWTVCAFLLSTWLFLNTKHGPATSLLDRQEAEGRIVSSGARSGRLSGSFYSTNSAGARSWSITLVQPEQNRWKRIERFTTANFKPQTPQGQTPSLASPAPKALRVAASVDKDSLAPKASSAKRSQPKVSSSAASKALSAVTNNSPSELDQGSSERLLYPSAISRPDHTSLANLTEKISKNMIRLMKADESFHIGFLLDSSGKAIASSDCVRDGSLGRILIGRTFSQARVLGVDPVYRIALLQIQNASEAESVPLAPSPPAKGERLLGLANINPRVEPVAVRSGFNFAPASFFCEGPLDAHSIGGALLNDRGELVGCQFGTLQGIPGYGIHMFADSSVIFRLLRGYNPTYDTAPEDLQLKAASRLAELVQQAPKASEVKRNRILPGIGISQFYIGMTREDAGKWITSPAKKQSTSGIEVWTSSAPQLQLAFANGYLVAISTDFSGYSTESGISLGSAIDEKIMERVYGKDSIMSAGVSLVPGLDVNLDSKNTANLFVVKPRF